MWCVCEYHQFHMRWVTVLHYESYSSSHIVCSSHNLLVIMSLVLFCVLETPRPRLRFHRCKARKGSGCSSAVRHGFPASNAHNSNGLLATSTSSSGSTAHPLLSRARSSSKRLAAAAGLRSPTTRPRARSTSQHMAAVASQPNPSVYPS